MASREKFLGLLLTRLQQHVTKLEADGGKEALAQYMKLLPLGLDGPAVESAKPGNDSRNRYQNIPCFDHTRVILRENTADYINANWISGFRPPQAYIVTQG